MNRRRLKPHVERWVQHGVIAPEQGEAILGFYPEVGRSYWMLAYAVIGSLLILGGIILLIASNWQHLPPALKLAGLLVLLAASTITGVEAQVRGAARGLWESAYLGAAVFPLLGLMLISQIFHLYGKPTGLILAWTLATAPLPFLTRAVGAWVVQILALMALLGYAIHDDYLGERLHFEDICLIWVTFGAILALASQLWLVVGERIQRDVGEHWGLVIAFIMGYVWGFEAHYWLGLWLLLFLGALALIYGGYRVDRRHLVNLGFFITAIVILSVFFRLVGTMFDTGLIFIGGGMTIILTVWGLDRLRRRVLGAIAPNSQGIGP